MVGEQRLNAWATRVLTSAGFTESQWAVENGWSDGIWHGDACGCSDDRCIGHHHYQGEECGCLPVLLFPEDLPVFTDQQVERLAETLGISVHDARARHQASLDDHAAMLARRASEHAPHYALAYRWYFNA